MFDAGRVSGEGRANFLAEPNPTFRGDVELADIELDYFKPITNRYNLWVDKGILSAAGHVEYGQETETVVLSRASIDGIQVDYVHHRAHGRRRARDASEGRGRRQGGEQRPRSFGPDR